MPLHEIEYNHVAFGIADVDNLLEYKFFFNKVAEELSEFMDEDLVPFREHEDQTGTYLIAEFQSHAEAFNFMDLFIDAMTNPELELDIDDIDVYTHDTIVFQRFINAKQRFLTNIVCGMYDDVQDASSVDRRVLSIEEALEYNGTTKMRTVIQIIGSALEKNGIEVAKDINETFGYTIH